MNKEQRERKLLAKDIDMSWNGEGFVSETTERPDRVITKGVDSTFNF